MQSDCYRCGRPIEGQLAFCSACGAPQIRVSRTVETSLEETPTIDSGLPSAHLTDSAFPAGFAPLVGIAWKDFLYVALPLAVLTDILTMVMHPLAFFVLLPANLVWAISRYRRRHPSAIRSGQGARMGALMGLLSFAFFLAYFLVILAFQSGQYRAMMLNKIHEISAQNPDPQAQQMLQWFATPDGLIAFTVIALITILLICLFIGTSSGAMAGALAKKQKQT
jgi:hypothetical protein